MKVWIKELTLNKRNRKLNFRNQILPSEIFSLSLVESGSLLTLSFLFRLIFRGIQDPYDFKFSVFRVSKEQTKSVSSISESDDDDDDKDKGIWGSNPISRVFKLSISVLDNFLAVADFPFDLDWGEDENVFFWDGEVSLSVLLLAFSNKEFKHSSPLPKQIKNRRNHNEKVNAQFINMWIRR